MNREASAAARAYARRGRSRSRSPARVHNWEKSRFRRNVFEGRSRPGEVRCSEVDVRTQQVRARLSLALAPVFLFLDAFAIGFDNAARLSTARQRRRPAPSPIAKRRPPKYARDTRLASRMLSLARSLVHGFRDDRNESAGSRTTFLRLRRGAPSFRFRGRESSEKEEEKLASPTRRVVTLKCDQVSIFYKAVNITSLDTNVTIAMFFFFTRT